MSFHVGQRVVCIDDGPGLNPIGPLCKGQIYTIRGFSNDPRDPELGVYLEEILNLHPFHGVEINYRASRFRPVIERSTETGMAILRKVADDAAKRKNLVVTL